MKQVILAFFGLIALLIIAPVVLVIGVFYIVLYYTVYFPIVAVVWIFTHVFVFLLLLSAGKRTEFKFRSSPWEIVKPKDSFNISKLFKS